MPSSSPSIPIDVSSFLRPTFIVVTRREKGSWVSLIRIVLGVSLELHASWWQSSSDWGVVRSSFACRASSSGVPAPVVGAASNPFLPCSFSVRTHALSSTERSDFSMKTFSNRTKITIRKEVITGMFPKAFTFSGKLYKTCIVHMCKIVFTVFSLFPIIPFGFSNILGQIYLSRYYLHTFIPLLPREPGFCPPRSVLSPTSHCTTYSSLPSFRSLYHIPVTTLTVPMHACLR